MSKEGQGQPAPGVTPKPVKGYGWSTEATLLSFHHWMEFGSFLAVINDFKFKPFTVKAQRDIMRTTLENLVSKPPFSPSVQFPEAGIYIDLHHSVPLAYLRQLALALDISDRQSEKGRERGADIDKREHSNMEDAKVSFYSAVNGLLDLTSGKDPENIYIYGVYIRSTFEKSFRLTWT